MAEDGRKQSLRVSPDSVNSSVWQIPVALISTRTSPALGPSRFTSMISRGLPALWRRRRWFSLVILLLMLEAICNRTRGSSSLKGRVGALDSWLRQDAEPRLHCSTLVGVACRWRGFSSAVRACRRSRMFGGVGHRATGGDVTTSMPTWHYSCLQLGLVPTTCCRFLRPVPGVHPCNSPGDDQ